MRVRWSGGMAIQAPANCSTLTGRPNQSDANACSRSVERGCADNSPAFWRKAAGPAR